MLPAGIAGDGAGVAGWLWPYSSLSSSGSPIMARDADRGMREEEAGGSMLDGIAALKRTSADSGGPLSSSGLRERSGWGSAAEPSAGSPLSRTSALTCRASAKRWSSSADRRLRPASMRLTADWSRPTHLARARWLQPCRSRRAAICAPKLV